MPVQSTVPGLNVTRPEIYFGELTNTDVYSRRGQQELKLIRKGQANNLTSYEGTGGIVLGGLLRRIVLAFDRGDLGKLPSADDINARKAGCLMRRNVRDRVTALAPFLTYDPDPYMVVGRGWTVVLVNGCVYHPQTSIRTPAITSGRRSHQTTCVTV